MRAQISLPARICIELVSRGWELGQKLAIEGWGVGEKRVNLAIAGWCVGQKHAKHAIERWAVDKNHANHTKERVYQREKSFRKRIEHLMDQLTSASCRSDDFEAKPRS